MDTDEQVQAMRRAATPEWRPEGPVDELTIVWASEKRELFGRLETHAKLIEELNERMRTLEAWARISQISIGYAAPKSAR